MCCFHKQRAVRAELPANWRKPLKLVNDPQLRTRFGENGRQRVEQVFDIAKHVSKVEKLYKELLPAG